jgi:hypothetical protein
MHSLPVNVIIPSSVRYNNLVAYLLKIGLKIVSKSHIYLYILLVVALLCVACVSVGVKPLRVYSAKAQPQTSNHYLRQLT